MTQQMKPIEIKKDGNGDNNYQTQIYAKDSLDRFGDDLCQLLLSYLSLEDRFRYECVSKQFQRTVFESVVDIEIDAKILNKLLNSKKFMISSNIQLLATIAIKCPNIQCIDCRGMSTKYEEHIPEVLNTFRDNSRHLRDIYCNLWQNSDQLFPKFGPFITKIGNIYSNERQSLIHCHRLSEVMSYELYDVFDSASGQLLAKNLQKISFDYCFDSNDKQLSAFVAHNQSLKSVYVIISYDIHYSLSQLPKQLSRLTQLRELTLDLYRISEWQLLSEFLSTIGLNCKQLKRLSLKVRRRDSPLNVQLLDSLISYRRLKRFRLTLFTPIDEELLDPMKPLVCLRLTHLTLYLMQMNANFLNNCLKLWPRLQYLHINTISYTRECLSHLSRLPALQMLVIQYYRSDDLSDNDFTDLLSSSPKLKCIETVKHLRAPKRISKFYCRKIV